VNARRIALGDAHDAADLRAFLQRLLRYEPLCAIRLRAQGGALGAFARPPFGVLVLRVVQLAAPATVDATVQAARVVQALAEGSHEFELPEEIAAAGWAGVLPPSAGWELVADVSAGPVRDAVADGIREFRTAAEALPEERRGDRALLDRLAAHSWDRPVLAGVPLRAAHAANSLGFLAGDRVRVLSVRSWLRLDGSHGSAFVRRGGPSLQLA
jgi:hypothetical protein